MFMDLLNLAGVLATWRQLREAPMLDNHASQETPDESSIAGEKQVDIGEKPAHLTSVTRPQSFLSTVCRSSIFRIVALAAVYTIFRRQCFGSIFNPQILRRELHSAPTPGAFTLPTCRRLPLAAESHGVRHWQDRVAGAPSFKRGRVIRKARE